MQEAKEEFNDIMERFIALQFLFDKQWKAVKVSIALFTRIMSTQCCLQGSQLLPERALIALQFLVDQQWKPIRVGTAV